MEQGELDQSQGELPEDDSYQDLSRLPDQDLSRLPEQYFTSRTSSGPLEASFQNLSELPSRLLRTSTGPLTDISTSNLGVLELSQSSSKSSSSKSSSRPGLLDKYLLSQSSQSIDNFLTPTLGSVQSGLLELSRTGDIPQTGHLEESRTEELESSRTDLLELSRTENVVEAGQLELSRTGLLESSRTLSDLENLESSRTGSLDRGQLESFVTNDQGQPESFVRRGHHVDQGQLSNRSSLVLSEDEMKSVTAGDAMEDIDDMIVEVGNLDQSTLSHAGNDFYTGVS